MRSDPDLTTEKALDLLSAVLGEYVWFVRRSADDVLRMDFGRPHLRVREPARPAANRTQAVIEALERRIVTPTGQWHLFIDDAEWSIVTRFHSTKRGDPDTVEASATLRQLDGQKLTKVDFIQEPGSWLLEFDLGGSLTMSPSRFSEEPNWANEDQWVLFYEDGTCASYTNGKSLINRAHDQS